MNITIPGTGSLTIETIILDLNGTLTVGGKLLPKIQQRIKALKQKGLKFVLFSGDTRGNGLKIAKTLGVEFICTKNAEEKAKEAKKLNPKKCAAIGNGLIDLKKMKIVKLKIVVLQAEGVHIQTLLASDIIVPSIQDALDLFIDENRLIATLRK